MFNMLCLYQSRNGNFTILSVIVNCSDYHKFKTSYDKLNSISPFSIPVCIVKANPKIIYEKPWLDKYDEMPSLYIVLWLKTRSDLFPIAWSYKVFELMQYIIKKYTGKALQNVLISWKIKISSISKGKSFLQHNWPKKCLAGTF